MTSETGTAQASQKSLVVQTKTCIEVYKRMLDERHRYYHQDIP